MANGQAASGRRAGFDWRHFLAVLGPGIVAMLADTDAGSLVTAAQSGARYGYRLLWLMLATVPILYMVQELTVRLGAVEQEGHAALIRRHFGRFWAWVSVSTLVVACLGALLTELGGLAGVGAMLGVPGWAAAFLAAAALVAVAMTGSYRSVERIALAAGALEIVFLVVAVWAHPSVADLAREVVSIPVTDGKYMLLVSANIGAVIMPWMVFYQQASVVEKGLSADDIADSRRETAIGAVVTQLVMAAVMVACAAALRHGAAGGGGRLDTVGQIADALTPVLGPLVGRAAFGLGVAGAAIVAAIAVTLTAARALGEMLGFEHALDASVNRSPWFYGVYAAVLALGAAVVASGADIVSLSVAVQVMNALLLPIVLGFLFLLARRLPEPHRLQGTYAAVVGGTIAVTVLLGLYAGVAGIWS